MNEKIQVRPISENKSSGELNPFVYRLHLDTFYDYFKLIFMSIFVAPLRIIGICITLLMAYALATIGLWGLTKEDIAARPISGWRGKVRWYMYWTGRMMIRCYGFINVKTKGQLATRSEAPVLIVAPHTSFFDAIVLWWCTTTNPSVVGRIENCSLPFFGKCIEYTQPVNVFRQDQNSRQTTIQEINRRVLEDQAWHQIMVFPEGTCTNRSCLITFKVGAFLPGVPVQPIIIRYPNRTNCFSWTWDGPGGLKLIWVTLCQFVNHCEIEYLPVYKPSLEEKQDAKLFAFNVRQLMAKELGLPVIDYTFDDCRIMHKARLKHLPPSIGLIQFQNLRREYGVDLSTVQNQLLSRFSELANENGQITLEGFSRNLFIPIQEPMLVDLFNMYDKNGTGTISFRDYIIGECMILKPTNTEENLRNSFFSLFDVEKEGHVTSDHFGKVLRDCFDVSTKDALKIFNQIDVAKNGFIEFENYVVFVGQKPEYATIFISYQRAVKEGIREKNHQIAHGKAKGQ